MTLAEYLATEADSPEKREFVNGEIIAMSGVSTAHALVQANLTATLVGHLRGGPCRVLTSDHRVRIDETGMYAYPDLSVFCGKPRTSTERPPSLLNPTVVFEVLSESSERYDRGAKATHYRRRESLQAYVLVASQEKRVEVFARNPDSSWTLTEATGEGTVRLTPLGVDLPLAEVYAGVDDLPAA